MSAPTEPATFFLLTLEIVGIGSHCFRARIHPLTLCRLGRRQPTHATVVGHGCVVGEGHDVLPCAEHRLTLRDETAQSGSRRCPQ